jgi:CRP-like cAMP-binding protein
MANKQTTTKTKLKTISYDVLNNKVDVFRHSRYFANLAEPDLESVANQAQSCHFKKGEFIFYEQENPGYFYIVAEGRVRLLMQSESGKSLTVGVMARGEALHFSVLFKDRPFWTSAQAVDDAILLRILRDEFLTFFFAHSNIAINYINALADQIYTAYDRLKDTVVSLVDQRVLKILYLLSSKFGNTLSFTTEEIAGLAGISPETASRALSRLKHLGIIESNRRKIIILG